MVFRVLRGRDGKPSIYRCYDVRDLRQRTTEPRWYGWRDRYMWHVSYGQRPTRTSAGTVPVLIDAGEARR